MPYRFRLMSLVCSSLLAIAYAIAIAGILIPQTMYSCYATRKVCYALAYSSFFVYDIYQFMKIKTLTGLTPSATYRMYALLLIRCGSYCFNITHVSGNLDQNGSCTADIDPINVYQEHISSILFEIVLGAIFILWIRRQQECTPEPELLTRFIDIETASFFIYFFCEVVYVAVYSTIGNRKRSTPLLNSLYLMVPILLFYLNTLFFACKSHQKCLKKHFNKYASDCTESDMGMHDEKDQVI